MRRLVFTFLCVALLWAARPALAQVTYSIVASFPAAGGSSIPPVLVRGADGNLYGVIDRGGAFAKGFAFKVDTTGAVSVLHSFTELEGRPSGLMQASDGNLYGSSYDGGALTLGGIFRLTTTGVYTNLYTFTFASGGFRPYASLIEGSDGWLYGTQVEGGPCGGCGGIFKINTSGSYISLHTFSTPSLPTAPLLEASDGNFYGTTRSGGSFNKGMLFRMTPPGAVTILRSFDGTDGQEPRSGLIEGTDGRLYGTTFRGGAAGLGTVYTSDLSGAVTLLHNFTGADGHNPAAALLEASDGNLYGATESATAAACPPFGTSGRAFRLTTAGSDFTILHEFGCPGGVDGMRPQTQLVEGPAGTLHGMTTLGGGTGGGGSIFRLTFAVSTTTTLNVSPASAIFNENVTLEAIVTGGTPTGTVRFFDGATDIGTAAVVGGIATLNPSLSVGAHSFTASYEPTGAYVASVSDAVALTVAPAPTGTLLVVGPTTTVVLGESVTFTATVSAAVGGPTGSVQFFDGATSLGMATLSGGTASLATSTLAIGAHPITAVYLGDGNFAGSTSDPATVTVATVYTFGGFAQPLLPDGSASIQQNKTGRTIPVKFFLTLNGQRTGAAVATIGVYKLLDVASGTVDTTDLTEDAGAANENSNLFRYDAVSQQYVYNLSTKGWAAPATYRIVVTLNDGGVYYVNFSLR